MVKTRFLLVCVVCLCVGFLSAAPRCEDEEVCDDGVDNDGDDAVDCADDDCDPCPELCGNGVDDDADALIDCDDEDCHDGRATITEVMYQPMLPEVLHEYVEICNIEERCADLSGATIRDGSGVDPTLFPNGIMLQPWECVMVTNNPVDEEVCGVVGDVRWRVEVTLNNEGDSVTLTWPDGMEMTRAFRGDVCAEGVSIEYINNTPRCAETEYECGLGTPGTYPR